MMKKKGILRKNRIFILLEMSDLKEQLRPIIAKYIEKEGGEELSLSNLRKFCEKILKKNLYTKRKDIEEVVEELTKEDSDEEEEISDLDDIGDDDSDDSDD
jgi:hypothetical protein